MVVHGQGLLGHAFVHALVLLIHVLILVVVVRVVVVVVLVVLVVLVTIPRHAEVLPPTRSGRSRGRSTGRGRGRSSSWRNYVTLLDDDLLRLLNEVLEQALLELVLEPRGIVLEVLQRGPQIGDLLVVSKLELRAPERLLRHKPSRRLAARHDFVTRVSIMNQLGAP